MVRVRGLATEMRLRDWRLLILKKGQLKRT